MSAILAVVMGLSVFRPDREPEPPVDYEVTVSWSETTTDIDGRPIAASDILYTIYINGKPSGGNRVSPLILTLPNGCHELAVSATRIDTDPPLESALSKTVEACQPSP